METDNQNKPDNHIDFFAPKVLWLIIGILLLVVIIGASSWWQEVKKSEKIEKLPITCSRDYRCAPNVENSSNTADTSTWKTYSNAEFGFEFKYPTNWSYDNDNYYDKAAAIFFDEIDPKTSKRR